MLCLPSSRLNNFINYDFERDIVIIPFQLQSKLQKNVNQIRSICIHEFTPEISYGDKTQYICVKCQTYQSDIDR